MSAAIKTAQKQIFIDNAYPEALQTLKPLNDDALGLPEDLYRASRELFGYAWLFSREYALASKSFSQGGNLYLSGYSHLLAGQLQQATNAWQPLLQKRPNHWCATLYGMASGNLQSIPTFLQIRNHLEADIMNLWKAKQWPWVENILFYVEFLSNINYEAYKFAGRAFYHMGQYEKAGPLLLRGQKILPNDAEVYFHLGQYYTAIGQHKEAMMVLQQCLLISPTYTPAQWLRDQIQTEHTITFSD